jgi:predicted outer membrane repeat protein
VNSTISGNSAKTSGGGISGGPTVENSTISGNSAGMSGGGIYGSATVENSTISGNSAGTSGGGIYNNSSLDVTLSTITGNSAPSGGGIYNVGSVEVSNTILNAGASGENIFNDGGTVTSEGYNLSSDDGGGYLNGPGDQINTDPLLGPLQDNGGPTFTHALLPGSPAINAGDPSFTPPPYYDQRGPLFRRVFNRRIDIGSFETQPTPPPFPRPRPTPPR